VICGRCFAPILDRPLGRLAGLRAPISARRPRPAKRPRERSSTRVRLPPPHLGCLNAKKPEPIFRGSGFLDGGGGSDLRSGFARSSIVSSVDWLAFGLPPLLVGSNPPGILATLVCAGSPPAARPRVPQRKEARADLSWLGLPDGGGGSRTRVRIWVLQSLYVRRTLLVSSWAVSDRPHHNQSPCISISDAVTKPEAQPELATLQGPPRAGNPRTGPVRSLRGQCQVVVGS